MIALAVIAVAAALWAAGVTLAYVRGRRDALRAGETVIVATRRPDDQSILGVVVSDTAARITLAGAHYLEPDGTRTPFASPTVQIERPVAFVQVGVEPVPVRSADAPGRPAAPPLPDPRQLRSVADRAAREA